jgi:ribosome-associated protein
MEIDNINEIKNNKPEEDKYLEINPGQLEKAKELAEKISIILDDKKARSIKIIETNKQTIIADYFVIATGTSSTHIRSLAGEVEFQLKEQSNKEPSRTSGKESNDWIIIDYDSVLVHIFNSEARDYYKLEKLWGDGESINVEEILNLENK